MTAQSIKYLLTCARQKLDDSPSAGIDSEVLLAHVLETGRSFLYANPELELPRQRVKAFRRLVTRRAKGEPVAYLTGSCEFWSLRLDISPAVLIPRPETELIDECHGASPFVFVMRQDGCIRYLDLYDGV